MPAEWHIVTIPELIGFSGVFVDGDWVESKDQDPNRDIRLIQLADIGDGFYVNKSNRYLMREKAAELRCTLLKAGDVLLARMPDPLGRACIFPGDPRECVTVVDVCIVRPHKEIDRGWLMSAINAQQFREAIRSRSSGTTRTRISRGNLGTVELPLPPANEQRRIVAKIDALTAKSRRAKEVLNAIPPLLDKLRQSILAAAFRGDLTADWRAAHPDVEPASQLLERIRAERRRRWEEAELAKMKAKGKPPADDRWKAKYQEPEPNPRMPVDLNMAEGWVTAELEALCDPVRGIPYGIVLTGDHTDGGVPTVRCGDIKSFGVQLDRLKCVRRDVAEQYERTRLRGGEVLLAIRGTVGATAVVPPAMAGMNISREVAMLTPLPGLNPEYLSYLIGNPTMQAALGDQVKGVAQAGINLADLRRLRTPLPPEREQAAIVAAIHGALDKVSAIERAVSASLQNLPDTESGILAKAFRGELVPQDPNDEPASVLLERIRTESGVQPKQTSRRHKAKTA